MDTKIIIAWVVFLLFFIYLAATDPPEKPKNYCTPIIVFVTGASG